MTQQPTREGVDVAFVADPLFPDAPCFVHHPDAGGQCERTATMRVYGLHFCDAHGKDARLGAISQAIHEAFNFFSRFRNPEAEGMSPLIDTELGEAAARLRCNGPTGTEETAALLRAYPNTAEHVRDHVTTWERDEEQGEEPYRGTVYDSLQDTLYSVHKVMRIAFEDGETWLVELLEYERESVAAQAAYALRERVENRPGSAS